MTTRWVPCSPQQPVEGRIRNQWGDLVWRAGVLRGWSLHDGAWVAHVHYRPREGVEFTVRLPEDRVRGSVAPR